MLLCGKSHGYNRNPYKRNKSNEFAMYEGWNFNRGNYLFTTDTK